MKNKLLKDLWHVQDGFSEVPICHEGTWSNNPYYYKKYKDSPGFFTTKNPQGFRSKYDFSKLPEDAFKIGFFGCSITEGVGLCDGHRWVDMFLEEFKTKYNKNAIGLNFGKAACSNDYVLYNIEKALEEVELDLVCCLLPTTNRRTFASPDSSKLKLPPWLNLPFVNLICSKGWGPYASGQVDRNEYECLTRWIFTDENNYLNFSTNVRCIRYFLKEKNIPFILNKNEDSLFKDGEWLGDRTNVFGINVKFMDVARKISNNPELDFAYSKGLDFNVEKNCEGHPGIAYHEEVTKVFLKDYEDINKTT